MYTRFHHCFMGCTVMAWHSHQVPQKSINWLKIYYEGTGQRHWHNDRGQLKCDGTCTETRFCLSAKRWVHLNWQVHQFSPLLMADVCASALSVGSNAGYTMFQGSEKGTGYPLHLPVSPSLPLLCITVCCYISTGVY
jgi:hypothetical protein